MKSFSGRVISKRKKGNYLFLDIEGMNKLQVVIEKENIYIKKGDVIEGDGEIDINNQFGLSILAKEIKIISLRTEDIKQKFNFKALHLKSELFFYTKIFKYK